MQLDLFQKRAVLDVLGDLRGPSRTALLIAPTGSGKTIMMAASIKAEMLRRRHRVLILQHTTPLLGQNLGKVRAICSGLRFGELGAGKAKGLADADVTVATVQAAQGEIADHLAPFDLVVIDEAHHAAAPGYRALLKRLYDRNPNLMLLGLTATPERADGLGLDALFARISHQVSFADVLATGRIVPPRVLMADLGAISESLRAHAWTDGDDASASKALRVEVTMDEMVRQHQARAEGRRAVYFCCDTDHAEALAATFAASGLRAKALSYRTRRGDLKRILAEFADGAYDVVTNPLMLTEGFDDPGLGCIGLARGFGTKHLMVQAVGRVLRASPGKRDGLVLDFVHAAERHGDLFPNVSIVSRARRKGAGHQARDGEATETIAADAVDMTEIDMLGGLLDRIDIGDAHVAPVEAKSEGAPRIISRAEAKALGLSKYFTGQPCNNGHTSPRWTNHGTCAKCQYAKQKNKINNDPQLRAILAERQRVRFAAKSSDPEWRAKLFKRQYERYKVKSASDPQRKAKAAARQRAWRAAKYASDPEWRAKLLKDQCARNKAKSDSDPQWKAKVRERKRKWAAEKMVSDPDWRSKRNEKSRAYRAAKMARI